MIEIIFTIIVLSLVFSSIYMQNRLMKNYQEQTSQLLKQNEIEKHNLVAALKSHTIQDYTTSSVYPQIIEKEEFKDEETNYQNLDEFSIENPDLFDKSLGIK